MHVFFCDEAGNSGSRFYDLSQPYYAEGGWILDEEHVPAASAFVLEREKANRYTAKTKGSNLRRSRPGLSHCNEVISGLGERSGIPYLYIVEKRFAVCAKIVETLLDCEYNTCVETHELADPDRRQAEAHLFYGGPEELVAAFADAYRTKDPGGIRSSAQDWVRHFTGQGDAEFAQKVAGCLSTIEHEVAGEFDAISSENTPSGFDSLNMPSIARVYQHAENSIPYPCRIVHDDTASFRSVYEYVYEMYANGRRRRISLRDGRHLTVGFRNLKGLVFEDSELDPMLRASDYLVATAIEFIRRAWNGDEISPDLTQCAFASLGGIMVWAMSNAVLGEPCPVLGEVFASCDFVGRVFRRLMRELQERKG